MLPTTHQDTSGAKRITGLVSLDRAIAAASALFPKIAEISSEVLSPEFKAERLAKLISRDAALGIHFLLNEDTGGIKEDTFGKDILSKINEIKNNTPTSVREFYKIPIVQSYVEATVKRRSDDSSDLKQSASHIVTITSRSSWTVENAFMSPAVSLVGKNKKGDTILTQNCDMDHLLFLANGFLSIAAREIQKGYALKKAGLNVVFEGILRERALEVQKYAAEILEQTSPEPETR